MPTVCGIVLAAGAGRRFGAVKQLADLGGRPLLRWAVDAATGAARLDRVVVVLGAHAEAIRAAEVVRPPADAVVCAAWEEGLAASLRSGLAAAGDADWAVVTLGDAPLVSAAAIDAVAAAARSAPPEVAAVRARWDGRPGHPVALRRALWPAIAALRGDEGARSVLATATVLEIDADGLGAPDDADTPEALDRLRNPVDDV